MKPFIAAAISGRVNMLAFIQWQFAQAYPVKLTNTRLPCALASASASRYWSFIQTSAPSPPPPPATFCATGTNASRSPSRAPDIPGIRLIAKITNAIPIISRPTPMRSSALIPSRRTHPSRYSPAIEKSTIHAARNRSRVRNPHRSTWSRLARYLRLAARITNPITTFTRAIHPPLRGIFFRYDGKSARKKYGSDSPVAKVAIPIRGRVPPLDTEAASSVPTNGPTQANDANENVRPMSSVPTKPPLSDDAFSFVSTDEGIVISNAPSKLNPNAMNSAEMKPFTHGLDPSATTPNGPSSAVIASPIPVNSTIIPRQNTTACATLDWRFRKYDIVIGIIGNTHGVKIEASPKPKATSRNAPIPCS